MPESATIGSIPAANGRCAWRDREIWMQSEAGLTRIILAVYPRLSAEEGAKGHDFSMRTGLTCMSTPDTRNRVTPRSLDSKLPFSGIVIFSRDLAPP